MPDTTQPPIVQLVDVVLADLDRMRLTIDGARFALAGAAETIDASRTGLVALRESAAGRDAR